MGQWLWDFIGLGGTGPWFNFWQGFGSDLSMFGAVAVFCARHNCSVKRCWRFGKVDVQGVCVCWRHHPEDKPTAGQVSSFNAPASDDMAEKGGV
jgi:hypothetical protein